MKKGIIAILALVLVFGIAALSYATESSKSAGQVAKDVVTYPVKVVKEGVDVVAGTTQQSAEVVANEANNVAGTLTGDSEKAKGMVVDPVTGTCETVKDAVVNTANIPMEAAKTK